MASEVPLTQQPQAGANGEFGRAPQFDAATGPRDLARALGSPSLAFREDGSPEPNQGR